MNAALIREVAALSGLELPLERAEALMSALEPVFTGDAAIIALDLRTLSPLATPWTLGAAPLETATIEAVTPEVERD